MENKQIGLTVFATSLGFLLVQLDVSIINVSLAAIGAQWQVGSLRLQWVVDSYVLGFASLLSSTGAPGNRIGHRRMFILGLALFTGASAACGLSWRNAALIAARVLQGAGAAALVPSSLVLLTRTCGEDGKLRAWGVGWWTPSGTVGLAAEPLLGGVLVDLLGWRSIFLVNLPVGMLGIWLTRRFVAASTPTETRLDWIGQALAIVALLRLTGTVIEAPRFGWSSFPVGAGLIVGIMAIAAFITQEHRGTHPMLPLRFFRDRRFTGATLVGFFDQHDPLRGLVRAGSIFPGDQTLAGMGERHRLSAAARGAGDRQHAGQPNRGPARARRLHVDRSADRRERLRRAHQSWRPDGLWRDARRSGADSQPGSG